MRLSDCEGEGFSLILLILNLFLSHSNSILIREYLSLDYLRRT